MTAPERRRDAVARILRSRRIGTQEELLDALRAAGFDATQATLSRDLARLGARRVSRPEGGTIYELADGAPAAAAAGALGALGGLVSSVDWNRSLVIIRTHPGSAPAVARAIDLAELGDIAGTIAGDDTIFVAPAGDLPPRRLAARLARWLGLRESGGGPARAR
jgi:transcriptional regulator of arginine metabolism